MSMMSTGRKRLHHVERQKDNILLRAVPDFMKIGRQERQVVQLKVDE